MTEEIKLSTDEPESALVFKEDGISLYSPIMSDGEISAHVEFSIFCYVLILHDEEWQDITMRRAVKLMQEKGITLDSLHRHIYN